MLALLLLLSMAAPDDLSAIGVVVSPRPERSSAVLRSHGQSRVVAVGDTAFGGRVSAISQETVSLSFGDSVVEVRVRGAKAPATLPAAPLAGAATAPAAGAAATASLATAHEASPAPRTMSREQVQRRIADEAPRILAETAIAPAPGGGVTLTKIAPGLLTEVGLQPGDVLTQVNGTTIDGLPTLMGLWTKLQGERSLSAIVLRNGQPVTLSVNLR